MRKEIVIVIVGLIIGLSVIPNISGNSISNITVNSKEKNLQGNFDNEWNERDFLYKVTYQNGMCYKEEFNSDNYLYINTGLSVCETKDNNFVIVGSTGKIDSSTLSGSTDIILVKADENGLKKWIRTFRNDKIWEGLSVQQTFDSGFIITGISLDYSNSLNILLVKTDKDGEKIWSKKYDVLNYAIPTQAIQTSDGGYLLTGDAISIDNPSVISLFLVKTDENGNVSWVKTFEEKEVNVGYSIIQIDDEYLVSGYTADFDETAYPLFIKNMDILLVKVDENGNEIISETYNIENDDACFSISQTNDLGCILTGSCNALSTSDPSDLYILKLDEKYDKEWYNIFDDKIGKSVYETDDHGFVIGAYQGGCSAGSCIISDALIIKTDDKGNKEWEKSFSGVEQAICNNLCITEDNGYILTGVTVSSDYENFGQILLIKTDENGNKEWENTYYKNIPKTTLLVCINEGQVTIENTGDIFAADVEITIEITGGILGKINGESNMTFEKITEGEIKTIVFPSVFGIGKVDIISIVDSFNANYKKEEAKGFVFLFFLKIIE